MVTEWWRGSPAVGALNHHLSSRAVMAGETHMQYPSARRLAIRNHAPGVEERGVQNARRQLAGQRQRRHGRHGGNCRNERISGTPGTGDTRVTEDTEAAMGTRDTTAWHSHTGRRRSSVLRIPIHDGAAFVTAT